MKRHLPSLALLVGVVVLATWPLAAVVGVRALGHPLSDLADHYWGAWWWGGELLDGRLPLQTTVSHLPAGRPLWYVDPVGALLALPFRPLGFPAAWNLSQAVQVLAAGVAAYGVAFRWFQARGPALLAGVAVVTAPYLGGLLHSGLSEYTGLAFPVLFVGAALAAAEGDRRARWWLGPLLAACTLQSFYYGAFAALFGACALVGSDPVGRLRRLAPGLLAGLALSAPLLWVAGRSVFGGAGVVDSGNAPGWTQVHLPAVDVSLFLRPGKHWFPDTPALGNPGILQVQTLGWVLVGLAAWGFARHPRLRPHRWAVLVFGILCLGPALAWNGQLVTLGGRDPVPLPLALLYRLPGSPFALVHHPYRLVGFLVPLLALGAVGAAVRLPRAGVALAGVALAVEGLLLGAAPWPLPTAAVTPPAIYADLPGPGGVLDWPPDGTDWNRRYEIWQVGHGRAMPHGVNTFLTEPVLADPLVVDLLGVLDDPRGRTRNRDVRPPVRFPAREGPRSDLPAKGIRWVVLHDGALTPVEAVAAEGVLERWLGPAVVTRAGARAWAVPDGAVAPPSPGAPVAEGAP